MRPPNIIIVVGLALFVLSELAYYHVNRSNRLTKTTLEPSQTTARRFVCGRPPDNLD